MSEEDVTVDELKQIYGGLLEGEVLPVCGARLVKYVDEDAKGEWVWKIDGVVTAAEMIGALEVAQFEIMLRHISEYEK